MAEEKKVVEAEVTDAKPAKKTTKKATKAEVKADTKEFKNPTYSDYGVIIEPVITEKGMTQMQELNQVSLKVKENANKTEIKLAFERIFKVNVTNVRIVNVRSKETTRGSRYKGTISGYKKAIVSIKEGQAIDLFKE